MRKHPETGRKRMCQGQKCRGTNARPNRKSKFQALQQDFQSHWNTGVTSPGSFSLQNFLPIRKPEWARYDKPPAQECRCPCLGFSAEASSEQKWPPLASRISHDDSSFGHILVQSCNHDWKDIIPTDHTCPHWRQKRARDLQSMGGNLGMMSALALSKQALYQLSYSTAGNIFG